MCTTDTSTSPRCFEHYHNSVRVRPNTVVPTPTRATQRASSSCLLAPTHTEHAVMHERGGGIVAGESGVHGIGEDAPGGVFLYTDGCHVAPGPTGDEEGRVLWTKAGSNEVCTSRYIKPHRRDTIHPAGAIAQSVFAPSSPGIVGDKRRVTSSAASRGKCGFECQFPNPSSNTPIRADHGPDV